MSDDSQGRAESIDEDMIGGTENAVLSDDVEVEYPPDRLHGIQFADADVTDESIAERLLQEEPEVWEQAPVVEVDPEGAADEQLEQIIEL